MDKKLWALRKVLLQDYGYNSEELDENTVINLADEYKVLTESEASIEYWNNVREYVNENINDLLDDEWYLYNYINKNELLTWIMNTVIETLTEMSEEELQTAFKNTNTSNEQGLIEYYMCSITDPIDYILDTFGEDYFKELIKSEPKFYDRFDIFFYVLKNSDRGEVLATYDGIEHKTEWDGETFYVYKI